MYQTNNFIKIAALSNDNYQYDEIKQMELDDLLSSLDVPSNSELTEEWYGFETGE